MMRTTAAIDSQPQSKANSEHLSHRPNNPEAVIIFSYANEIPSFVEAEMERLYGSLYSSLPQLKIDRNIDNVNTYVVRKGCELVTVFLFRLEKQRVEVLNEVINIDEEDISRFLNYVFATFKSAQVVIFRAIQTNFPGVPFLYQRFNYLEDIVVTLPDSAEDYMASLGKNTRRNIRRHLKALAQDFPSFSFHIAENDDFDEQYARKLAEFNKGRMAAKKKVSAIDEEATLRTIKLAKRYGLAGIVTIDNQVCAGAISYRVGENYFLEVLAHDPKYDAYSLGTLCCVLTICECIERGGKEFHFLWGRYEYKYTLLGVQRNLDYLALYRSRLHFFLNANTALRVVARDKMRRFILWLHRLERQESVVGRFALRGLAYLRALRKVKFSRMTK
jgi:hypothetical protein